MDRFGLCESVITRASNSDWINFRFNGAHILNKCILHKNRFHKLTWPKKIQKRNQNSLWIWIFLWWAGTELFTQIIWWNETLKNGYSSSEMNATVKILMLLCEIMTIFSWFILKAVTPWLEEKLASKPDDTAAHQTLSHIQHIGYQTSQKSNRTVSFSLNF